jgi:lipoprotein-anchoring transpeptidase ErfK/SrfK
MLIVKFGVSLTVLACVATKLFTAPARSAELEISVEQVNNPSLNEEVKPGASPSAILRAEILLDRAHFSPGQINDGYTDTLRKAVLAYRAAHRRPFSNFVDAELWSKLNVDHAPALQEYTLLDKDVSGPYTPNIPAGLKEKAKLKALNYRSAEEGLSEKFHCSPQLLRKLNPGKRFDTAGTQLLVPNVIVAPPAGKARKLVVSRYRAILQVLDQHGRVMASYPATMGSEHDPLPIGKWSVREIRMYPWFHYNSNLFWDVEDKNARAILPPGPNNPVGAVWIGLTKAHYGIHGTENPEDIGRTESHGCIRLTNWSVLEVASMIKKGMPVILQEP